MALRRGDQREGDRSAGLGQIQTGLEQASDNGFVLLQVGVAQSTADEQHP